MQRTLLFGALILATLVVATLTSGKWCGTACAINTNESTSMIQSDKSTKINEALSAQDFYEKSQESNQIILDVRTAQEFATGHIENAINIDFNQTAKFSEKLSELDKSANYLIYCRSGNRSSQAISLMQKQGFTNISHLQGGIIQWQAENLPLLQP
jgi:rhodanese-related sulfurtransferase